MIFHDFECDSCGHNMTDVAFASYKTIKREIACAECGESASMRFRKNNLIHHDHSSMYGRYHAGFGEVVKSYSHKQELMKKYNVVESSDAVGGSRNHITSDITDPAPRSSDPIYWGDTPDSAIAAAEQATKEQ